MNLQTKKDYAEAKKLLKELTWKRDNMRGSDSFTQHMKMHVSLLEAVLLAYRRKHNIFEVGDKVVYKGEAGLNGLFEIKRLTKTGKPKTVKTERFGNFPCRYCEVQHATDAEIQAGHRL